MDKLIMLTDNSTTDTMQYMAAKAPDIDWEWLELVVWYLIWIMKSGQVSIQESEAWMN